MLLVDVGICDSCVSGIKVGVGTCDAGVSLIIVGDSAGLCRSWLFCWADSFCSSSSDVSYGFQLRSDCPSHITWNNLRKMWTAVEKCSFMLKQ